MQIGFQIRTRFNEWLTGNRQLIKAHLDWSAYLEHVGEGENPDYEAEYADLQPLEIPADADHPNFYPYPVLAVGHRAEGLVRDILPLEISVDDDDVH